MFSYTITIYESTGSSVLKIDSLSETLKIDEALDSAVLTIPRSTRKENYGRFAPLHIVVSDGTNSVDRWYVTYQTRSELESFGSTPRYTHTLALIEPTKLLEKYIAGTLTFTQPLGGTQKTMKDVLDRIITLTPFVKYSEVSNTRVLTLDSTFGTYMARVKAPQIYLDKKNLREALIESLKYVNAIPRLTYNGTTWHLTGDFINNRHINITVENGIMDYLNEASGDEFAKKVDIFHENTIPTEDETATSVYANSISEVITVRDYQNLIIGTDSFQLQLTNKAYKVLSVSCVYGHNASTLYELDLTDYFPVKEVYNTYELQNSATNYRGSKRCSGYWTYGIDMLEGIDTSYGWFGIDLPLNNIISDAILLQYSDTVSFDYASSKDKISFQVEYIPYIETDRSEQYREDTTDFDLSSNFDYDETSIIINPSERINSSYQLTKNAFGQIQRIGVNTVAFSLKHKTLEPYNGSNNGIYSQGDYTNDGYFVTKIELIYATTYVIARYEMSKNFNRYAQFVNIPKEFRPYEVTLTKSDYTLKRDVIMRMKFIELSSTSSVFHSSSNLVTSFMNTFRSTTFTSPLSLALIKKSTTGVSYNNEAVLMPLILIAEKNTLKFKVDFSDTKLAGKKVITSSNNEQKQVSYTYDDGTIDHIKVELYRQYWNRLSVVYADYDEYAKTLAELGNQFPYVDTTKNIIIDGSVGTYTGEKIITAHVYNYASEFPTTGNDTEFYVALDTNRAYEWLDFLSNYELIGNAIAMASTSSSFSLDDYEILKDKSEILGLEATLPILPKVTELNRFIIGDMLSKDNVLIKARTTGKTLYWQVSSSRYTKANTENTGSVTVFSTLNTSTIINNYIDIPSTVYAYDNFALTDVNGNLYFAVNQRNLDGTKTTVSRIYFNFVDERS